LTLLQSVDSPDKLKRLDAAQIFSRSWNPPHELIKQKHNSRMIAEVLVPDGRGEIVVEKVDEDVRGDRRDDGVVPLRSFCKELEPAGIPMSWRPIDEEMAP
jgi:hypothetical protein